MRIPTRWLSTASAAIVITAASGLAAFAVDHVVEEAPAEEPVAEEPVAEEPVAEEPVAEEPVAEEPVAEEPVVEEPVVEEPVVEEPVVEEPVVEEPVAEEPVADAPVADETVEDVVEAPKNHGKVVSDFANTTELTGCARGQAVAAVARGGSAADAKACKAGTDTVAEDDSSTEIVTEPVTEGGDTVTAAASDGAAKTNNGKANNGKAKGKSGR